MENNIDIKYLNKDFSTFKADLIEYAKAYFPTVYTDFSQASPGTMFIDMASYVGDVLSFYLDNQIQETFVQYAKQKNNLYALAYMMGYTPKVTSAAVAKLQVYQVIPAITFGGQKYPDFTYCMVIKPGMTVKSGANGSVSYYIPNKIDFSLSSSLDPTEVSVYEINGAGTPQSYLLKKEVTAVSGEIKTQSFVLGSAQRFTTLTISDSDIVSIVNVTDSSNNVWYEVPNLAQDYIYNPVRNMAVNYPDLYQDANQVPYIMQKVKVDRRFTTRFTSKETLVMEFGAGVNSVIDDLILPNPSTVGVGLTSGSTTINTAFDPTNFLTTSTYGLAPYNTTLTVTYLVGGGAASNAKSGELSVIGSYSLNGPGNAYSNTLAVGNEDPASGGGDGDTVEEMRINIRNAFSAQMRAVTQQDYMERALEMPGKYGKVAKVYMSKDDSVFSNYNVGTMINKDPSNMSMYVLSLNSNGNLEAPSVSLLTNLQTYLSDYRMMTDSLLLKSGYIINIGCNFDIIMRPGYNSQDVISKCILALKNHFNINNWEMNQPIILSNVYSLLDTQDGVQTVKRVEIVNKSGESSGYSKYAYDIVGATINGVVYPSLDPSIFELRYPNTDINGRIVTL